MIYLLLAAIFILFPNSEYSPFTHKWNEILQKIGFISLTSGIFAGVLKSIQFTGLFQEELQKIVSGSQFLKNRKDLKELWKEISKIIYSKKFPEISEELEDTILNSYLPNEKQHYNQDVIVTINIHDLTDDLTITYTQTLEYFAILDSEAKSSNISYTQIFNDDEEIEEDNKLISFKIDDKDVTLVDCREKIIEDGKIKYIHKVPIEGKNKFKVYLKIKNIYSLKGQNVKLLRFNTITKNVDVTVAYNKDIQVSFFSVGLINDFEEIHTDIKNSLSRRHRKGLFLPKQGFGLSFNKI